MKPGGDTAEFGMARGDDQPGNLTLKYTGAGEAPHQIQSSSTIAWGGLLDGDSTTGPWVGGRPARWNVTSVSDSGVPLPAKMVRSGRPVKVQGDPDVLEILM